MKNKKLDNQDRLIQIRKAIGEIETYVSGVSREEFISNTMISSAVLFQFGVIAESVVHIDKELLDSYDYPWYQVIAFRNLISHEYFNIEFEAVWEIIVGDLQKLKHSISLILQDIQAT